MGRKSDAKERLIQSMIDLMWERSYGSLTIDVICAEANVKKGSFYYFFKSKLELGLAAMDKIWDDLRPQMDEIFSPSRPPLEALALQMDTSYQKTKEIAQKHGYVLGCPFFNIGAEVSAVEPELLDKINELLGRYQRYFEVAVSQAQTDGLDSDFDPKETARMLFNLYEGVLAQARMKNDPELIKDLPKAAARILGIAQLPEIDSAVQSM